MPRSLAFCSNKICENLAYLGKAVGGDVTSCTQATEIHETHLSQDIEDVFDIGLHQFLEDVRGAYARLGQQIEVDYRFYE
jgi:uncharacterized alpha-E superfamily protein